MLLQVRGHLQTILGADNIIVMLGGVRDVKIINLRHVLLAVGYG